MIQKISLSLVNIPLVWVLLFFSQCGNDKPKKEIEAINIQDSLIEKPNTFKLYEDEMLTTFSQDSLYRSSIYQKNFIDFVFEFNDQTVWEMAKSKNLNIQLSGFLALSRRNIDSLSRDSIIKCHCLSKDLILFDNTYQGPAKGTYGVMSKCAYLLSVFGITDYNNINEYLNTENVNYLWIKEYGSEMTNLYDSTLRSNIKMKKVTINLSNKVKFPHLYGSKKSSKELLPPVEKHIIELIEKQKPIKSEF